MKIVIIGGTGLVGSRLVERLRRDGREPLTASRSGFDTELDWAQVVVDLTDAPSHALLATEAAARVSHHVTLSAVGADPRSESGYLRAKAAQEQAAAAGPVPYTILRAPLLFELVDRLADSSTDGAVVRLPPTVVQPAAAQDVASTLADIAVGSPLNDTVELAGPDVFRLDDLARRLLRVSGDRRRVATDIRARFSGADRNGRSLIPGDDARVAPTSFDDWISQSGREFPCTA